MYMQFDNVQYKYYTSTCTCSLTMYSTSTIQVHDVIGDVERKKERKKERKTPEAMEK